MPVPKSYIQLEQPGSWSAWAQWINPKPQTNGAPFRMACCDCGLVHDMEFRAVAAPEEGEDRVSIEFRVRRNNRSTAQARRHVDYPKR